MRLIIKFLFIFLFVSLSVEANFSGKVVKIIDGDTIDVLNQNKTSRIRLYGIDAPERGQPYGYKSKLFLTSLVANKNVFIVENSKDRYNRILGVIYLDNKNINEILVINGLAWAYRYKQKPIDIKIAELELKAKNNRVGLWADEDPIEPYIYRKKNK